MQEADARGNLVFDAQIIALCREHGVSKILSNDRDLERFDGITVDDP
jgi:predicted nucleic acid-binding protein